ncbi:hypothetical protein ES288_A06G053800v1 [Gossypium darwinii]|uniref:Uncharacterized protein n=1 Tax=Gossypium darwinii TaxID=34276 RepID=A0A5D2G3W7_GOSDA|nr:hypothetical protein ES288_A06G053800v1 [Gossypium darwinii]
MEGPNMYGNGVDNGLVLRKRVPAVDESSHSKHAMIWALTHVANKGVICLLYFMLYPQPKRPLILVLVLLTLLTLLGLLVYYFYSFKPMFSFYFLAFALQDMKSFPARVYLPHGNFYRCFSLHLFSLPRTQALRLFISLRQRQFFRAFSIYE